MVLAGTAAAGLAWFFLRDSPPTPPAVDTSGDDGAVVRAVADATERVRTSPWSAEAWGDFGKLLRACRYLPEATACFDQAARLAPQDPRWPYLAGEALLPLGRRDEAIPRLQEAVDRCERVADASLAPRLRLAEVLLAAGREEDAEGPLRRAQELEPDHPSIHLNLGLLASAREDWPAARDHFLIARHSPFTRRRACTHLAAVSQRLGDEAAAGEFSRQAAAHAPDASWGDPWLMDCLRFGVGPTARFRYLEQLEAQGRSQEAVALLREMQAENGSDFTILVSLGQNLAEAGDLLGAEEVLTEALRLSPDSAQANYLLARVIVARARQGGQKQRELPTRYRHALATVDRALARDPDSAPALLIRASCLEGLGRRAEALTALRRAVHSSPARADAAVALGELLAKAGHGAEARELLERAVRLARPDDHRARAALARLLNRPADE